MAELTCGQGGSTGFEIITQINNNTNALAILNVLAQVDPRASVRLANEYTQTITDSAIPDKLGCFDTIITSQNGLVPTLTLDNTAIITNNTGNSIKAMLAIGLNVKFPSTETLEMFLFVDDKEYSDLPLVIQGDGSTKPISVYWESEIILEAGAVVDIRGRNADVGTYDITYLRSTFRVSTEWNEINPLPVQP